MTTQAFTFTIIYESHFKLETDRYLLTPEEFAKKYGKEIEKAAGTARAAQAKHQNQAQ